MNCAHVFTDRARIMNTECVACMRAERDEAQRLYRETAEGETQRAAERDAARAELAKVKAERDEALEEVRCHREMRSEEFALAGALAAAQANAGRYREALRMAEKALRLTSPEDWDVLVTDAETARAAIRAAGVIS